MRRTDANYSPETAAPAKADFPFVAAPSLGESEPDEAAQAVEAVSQRDGVVLDHDDGRLSAAARPARTRRKRLVPGRGRRTKRKRDDKRYRKGSRALTWDEFVLLDDGYYLARDMGRPLEAFLTLRPMMNESSRPDRQRLWQQVYKALQEFVRYRKLPFFAVWSRESDARTSDDEHWHILLWLPREHWDALRAKAVGWLKGRLSGRRAVDLKRRTYTVNRSKSGVPYTGIDYLRKASPTTARRKRPFYKKSGLVYGRRAGTTRNLGRSAVLAWRAHRERTAA